VAVAPITPKIRRPQKPHEREDGYSRKCPVVPNSQDTALREVAHSRVEFSLFTLFRACSYRVLVKTGYARGVNRNSAVKASFWPSDCRSVEVRQSRLPERARKHIRGLGVIRQVELTPADASHSPGTPSLVI
jgi:hypothetical protein